MYAPGTEIVDIGIGEEGGCVNFGNGVRRASLRFINSFEKNVSTPKYKV